ncbi:PREDICTED: leucine-rich repeat and immunoglobulin-like domain-containing nogo receptor-interacting protein 1-B [Branchiostoma belcheri]|uniref:Leucine-rich repeat and immunoglobulin-like domain-containing nogo receptor-interacting protein 1-B n=1 Tax=Branchiostoma belcheri TaxID=7741 RepID=A0A6P5A8A2_BRABE|nr:PREDICTED: leucine-rich repeat and immunoglobulin-like domain-containing nogo receptor-interacting protein 1-B [Branchiostoma belcheri]
MRQSDFSRYKQLNEIDIDDNNITVIQKGTFTNLPQLATLRLNNNAITIIQNDTFTNLPQLATLRPVLEGETVILNCDVSGIPTPNITVTLPSGVNATVESGGRVTVEANGIITIENITATDSGQYVCLAVSSGGSTSQLAHLHFHTNSGCPCAEMYPLPL